MERRKVFTLLIGAAAAWPLTASAQSKTATIGFLGAGAADTTGHLIEALKQGLRENGLAEGKDYVLELRWAEGLYERFPAFANDLVEKGARVIIVNTIAAARAAQRASSVIPIVMATMNDPVGNGLIASLARPGGNTTGLATLNQDLTPKLIELLRESLPKALTIAALFNPANPSNKLYLESARVEAGRFGMTVEGFAIKSPSELDSTFGLIAAQRPDGLLVIPDAATLDLRTRIAALALQSRIPVISTDPDLTSAGGLISYGISRRENFRRSAYFVKKILDGEKPADLPVEQPTRIQLSVNLKTAKALAVTVPPSMLALAEEVIE
jgi:putative tryptophan/tyrosine transport system substrate-binding protein